MSRVRNYCFTSWSEPKYVEEKSNYMIYQKEKCPSTGNIHYQGYIELKDKLSIKQVKEIIGDNKAHLEPRFGSQKQAIDYCKKKESAEGEHVEYGMIKNQGNRSDLDSIWDNIEDGMTSKEILHEHGGKALRVINMIIRGLESQHDCCAIDKLILCDRALKRQTDAESKERPEVDGNTETSTGQIVYNEIEIEKEYHMKDKMKKLKRSKRQK